MHQIPGPVAQTLHTYWHSVNSTEPTAVPVKIQTFTVHVSLSGFHTWLYEFCLQRKTAEEMTTLAIKLTLNLTLPEKAKIYNVQISQVLLQ